MGKTIYSFANNGKKMTTNTIIGYGSLIDPASRAKTIPPREATPIIVKGYRRIFNMAILDGPEPNVLNAERQQASSFNAVTIIVNEEELELLKRRETNYDPEHTPYYDPQKGEQLGTAIIFIGKKEAKDTSERPPNSKYLKLCRKAAYSIGINFGMQWDRTTLLADGTVLADWLLTKGEP